MAEQTMNLTVDEFTIENNKTIESFSSINLLEYSSDYTFLQDLTTSVEHLQMQKINMSPNNTKYKINFFEIINENILKQHQKQTSDNEVNNQQLKKKKIASLSMKEQITPTAPVKLPITKHPIHLQIQTKKQGLMMGTVGREYNSQNQTPLYNNQGTQVGTLRYQLKYIKDKVNHSQNVSRVLSQQYTLHSRDFQARSPSQSSVKIVQPSHEYNLIKIEESLKQTLGKIQQQQNSENIAIIDHSTKPIFIYRRKKPQNLDDSDLSQIEEKGSQNQDIQISQKITSYRMPIGTKLNDSENKQIDYVSLKRSKQELGLTGLNIQEMLYPKSLRDKTVFAHISKSPPIILPNQHNPQHKIPNEPQIIPNICHSYKQYGVGTYTPLSSHKSSFKESYSSFRSKSMKQSPNKLFHQLSSRQKHSSNKNVLQPIFSKLKASEVNNIQRQLMKRPQHGEPQKQKKLTVKNKVIDVQINQYDKAEDNILPTSLENNQKNKQKNWSSCKDSSIVKNQYSNITSENDSELYPEFSLIINNINLNFRRKTFGTKSLEFKLGQSHHRTEPLHGNNLIWVGKSYHFQRVVPNDQIIIVARGQNVEQNFIYGTIRVSFNDLLINKKQSYYQTFLLNDKQVLGVLILGFQILTRKDSIKRYIFPTKKSKDSRGTHSYTQVKGKRDFQRQNHKDLPKRYDIYVQTQRNKSMARLPSPRANRIKMRKYLGGKNIKIGRADRFDQQMNKLNPGPGNYQIQSMFSRHAYKQD